MRTPDFAAKTDDQYSVAGCDAEKLFLTSLASFGATGRLDDYLKPSTCP